MYKYLSTQTFHHEQDVTQDQFLSWALLGWIPRIYSPVLAAIKRLKSKAYHNIFTHS